MKQVNVLITEGKIDTAIALTISMLEPKKTLALNAILMKCIQEADLKHAEKVANLLNRNLDNFELKIFVDKNLDKKYFERAKKATLKMTEPDRTKYLVHIFNSFTSHFFNNRDSQSRAEILSVISLMTEPDRTACSNNFLERHLINNSFVGRAITVAEDMGRKLTTAELNKAFNLLYNSLIRNESYDSSYFNDTLSVIKLMPKSDRKKSRDLLLTYYLQKQRVNRLNSLIELLEEPELTATLNVIFNLQIADDKEEEAIKTANRMSEPHRSTILNNYLNDYVKNGWYEKSCIISQMMGKELGKYQMYYIIEALINQKHFEKAWPLAQKVDDSNLKAQILKQMFERDLEKGYFGQAHKFLSMMRDGKNKFEAAQALFDKIIVAPNWLVLCGEMPKLFEEAKRPAIIKQVQARYLKEGGVVEIANFFKDSGLDKTDLDVLLKRIALNNLAIFDLKELLPILSSDQKNIFLTTCLDFTIKIGVLDFLKKLFPFISEKQKITSCKKMASILIRAGNLYWAQLVLKEINETVSQSDLTIILKKNIAEGLYHDANKVAALLEVELTTADLGVILKKCLETGRTEDADEVAKQLLAKMVS